MKKASKIIAFVIIFLCLSSLSMGIELYVDEYLIQSDVAPYIEEGRTMVPVRFVAEAMGLEVSWDAERKVVRISGNDDYLELKLKSDIARDKMGETHKLDVPASSVQGRTFIPLRFIAEYFKKPVLWSEESRAVIIGEGDENTAKNFREQYGTRAVIRKEKSKVESKVWDSLVADKILREEVELDLQRNGKTNTVIVGRDSPSGFQVTIVNGDYGANIFYSSEELKPLAEEIDAGSFLEVAAYDVDGDARPELLIIYGKNITDKRLYIMKLNFSEKYPEAKLLWELQFDDMINLPGKGEIQIDMGDDGYYDSYKWNGEKFDIVKQEK